MERERERSESVGDDIAARPLSRSYQSSHDLNFEPDQGLLSLHPYFALFVWENQKASGNRLRSSLTPIALCCGIIHPASPMINYIR